MPEGEKIVVRAFVDQYLDDKKAEVKEIEKATKAAGRRK